MGRFLPELGDRYYSFIMWTIVYKEQFAKIMKSNFGTFATDAFVDACYSGLELIEKCTISQCPFMVAGIEVAVVKGKAKILLSLVTDKQLATAKSQFLGIVMEEWRTFLQAQKTGIMKLFNKYDANGDGVLTLSEFSVLIKDIEPEMSQNDAVRLFMKTLSMSTSWNPDEISPEAFCDMVVEHHLGGFGGEIFTPELYSLVSSCGFGPQSYC